MSSKTLILVCGALLTLGGCGQKNTSGNDEVVNVDVDNGTISNTTLAAEPTTSQGFVNTVAASDRFEVESSRLAATASKSASIKAFASKMITAHTDSTQKLKAAAAASSPALSVDDTLSAAQQQSLDALKAKSGADFDAAYAAAQVDGHRAALDLLNGYAASGDDAKLQDLARQLLPAVTAHFNMAKSLK